jgi:hypothetical protein
VLSTKSLDGNGTIVGGVARAAGTAIAATRIANNKASLVSEWIRRTEAAWIECEPDLAAITLRGSRPGTVA